MKNQRSKWRALRGELEELARQLAYTVRYDAKLNAPGGVCLLRGERLIVINSRLPESEQVQLFAQALRAEPLDDHYLRPGLRALLGAPDAGAAS